MPPLLVPLFLFNSTTRLVDRRGSVVPCSFSCSCTHCARYCHFMFSAKGCRCPPPFSSPCVCVVCVCVYVEESCGWRDVHWRGGMTVEEAVVQRQAKIVFGCSDLCTDTRSYLVYTRVPAISPSSSSLLHVGPSFMSLGWKQRRRRMHA